MEKPKIVVIGAGSASFGLSVLGALLQEKPLAGSRLCLVDINAEGLQKITALAQRLNREWGADFTIESTTDRREALPDADFVVLSIAVDREKCWRADFEIAQRYDIMHYAENGGPGGFSHAARNIPIVLDILRDVESLCPDAWVLNFTNPMMRICTAAARYTNAKVIGICHQLGFGYMMLGNILGKDLGIADMPKKYEFIWNDEAVTKTERYLSDSAMEHAEITAAGLNHFTWMLSIRERKTGRDLYPLLWDRLQAHHKGFEPLTQDMAEVFGVFPVPGDCHMVEYLPYTHNMHRKSWQRYNVQMYPLTEAAENRDTMWDEIEAMASGKASIEKMKHMHSERAEKVIAAIATGEILYEQALNLPNQGYITNLPEDAIVEIPAVVGAEGPRGVGVGALPDAIAEMCSRQVTVVELAVEAAVTGDRQKALQALALDPMIDDLDVARNLLNDYLEAHKDYLPQFA